MRGIIGPGGERHTPFIATLFLFILLNNLIGMVPGALAPTSSLNTTIALALITFAYVQIEGVRAHGVVGRLKHFMGPTPALAPLMFPIEIIGELARPLSLSIRLFGNIFGEEQVIFILAGLAYFILGFFPIPYQFRCSCSGCSPPGAGWSSPCWRASICRWRPGRAPLAAAFKPRLAIHNKVKGSARRSPRHACYRSLRPERYHGGVT